MDGFTMSAAVTVACDCTELIRQLHGLAICGGFDCYASVNNSLLTYYGKNGFLEEAKRGRHVYIGQCVDGFYLFEGLVGWSSVSCKVDQNWLSAELSCGEWFD
ncbi:hypothetical protein QQ045_001980 [Rhodiola kirilowii]